MPDAAARAWVALNCHRDSVSLLYLMGCIAGDAICIGSLLFQSGHVVFCFSRRCLRSSMQGILLELAEAVDLVFWRYCLFLDEHVFIIEGCAVLQQALRCFKPGSISSPSVDLMPVVRAKWAKMRALSDKVRSGLSRGFSHEAIPNVVNSSMDGSDLRPKPLVCLRLSDNSNGPDIPIIFSSVVRLRICGPSHVSRVTSRSLLELARSPCSALMAGFVALPCARLCVKMHINRAKLGSSSGGRLRSPSSKEPFTRVRVNRPTFRWSTCSALRKEGNLPQGTIEGPRVGISARMVSRAYWTIAGKVIVAF